MIHVGVEIQTTRGKSHHQIRIAKPEADFLELLSEIAHYDWGETLIDLQASPPKLIPGYMLVLDNRMVQPWELEDHPITDGQSLKIVQVVPGG
jgi:sulfur carrier protein ThiS